MGLSRKGKVAVGVVVILIIAAIPFMRSDSDGIEDGKTYALAMTYKTTIKNGNVEGRVFDFADRNLPRTSILVPIRDERGVELVKEVDSMAPSTVRKVRIRVPRTVIEGVTYPAYEYVQWQFRYATREVQQHVPTVTPRQ